MERQRSVAVYTAGTGALVELVSMLTSADFSATQYTDDQNVITYLSIYILCHFQFDGWF